MYNNLFLEPEKWREKMYSFSKAVLIIWIVIFAVALIIAPFGPLETWYWLCIMWPFAMLSGFLYLWWFNKWIKAERDKYYSKKEEGK